MYVVSAHRATVRTSETGTELRVLIDTTEVGQGRMSLAMETLKPGQHTMPHWHRELEEIYFILRGHGQLEIGYERRLVGAGDAILIPVDEVHCLQNMGDDDLVLLCPVSPPWYPEDYHAAREELDE